MENINTSPKLNSYHFDYYGWIPSYRDFDQSDITIEAENETEAWNQFNKKVRYASAAQLSSVNGIKLETSK